MATLRELCKDRSRMLIPEQLIPFDGLILDESLDIDIENCVILPGLCDVHVHFREPGFFYKESIATGSAAAARGGYTAVCTMPNLSPVPDCAQNLKPQLDAIARDAKISVYPYGAITKGEKGEELANMREIAQDVLAFSDDGRGVQDDGMMREAMKLASSLNKITVAHCEVNSLLRGGYIHDGAYAKAHGHRGICSESEYAQIERDVRLAKETGCAYHVCHVSAKESVDIIRKAKREGVNVTCETAPHYLVLDENDILEDGKYKMNPPLRAKEDRIALIEGVLDGTVDMIATDHAPHSAEEKSRGLEKSLFGIVGLETAVPVLYTYLVKTGIITLEKLVELTAINPRKRFDIPYGNDYCVWDLNSCYTLDTENFASKGRSTPFEGRTLYGKNLLTVHNGKTVYRAK